MNQCPLCHEVVEILTNYHCQTKHGISKKEIVKKYGEPKYFEPHTSRELSDWLKENTVFVGKKDFDIPQAAVRMVYKKF
ncbi:hypothetical protein skT53_14540 [Effusibacillus dendaii]|uniref:Uncharacterized protein n=1 Tax=Effusibacillus dendaii TaxID=2743772 RepID=A0A7I8DBW8_9BACL|nr:hypothetical protein skT53_14540 [Effusibacillus dendaii]